MQNMTNVQLKIRVIEKFWQVRLLTLVITVDIP